MDAPNPSATPTFASRTPLHIGTVGLIARDLDKLAVYYRDMLGLDVIGRTDRTVRLGAGGVTILELEQRPDAKPDDQREAGLYHTAFLMPTRADLARWVLHIARSRVPVTGASDHGVSEAFYLDDPEGNGVEVYTDRPAEELGLEQRPRENEDRPARHPGHRAHGRTRGSLRRTRQAACASATSICASATSSGRKSSIATASALR